MQQIKPTHPCKACGKQLGKVLRDLGLTEHVKNCNKSKLKKNVYKPLTNATYPFLLKGIIK